MIKQADIVHKYQEDGEFKKDFEFLGDDGQIYKLHVDQLNYCLYHYRAEDVWDAIIWNYGNNNDLVKNGICSKLELKNKK